ncbi:MAG TPA: hypothetical protein VGD59_14830 [Acidisarcina sp.]
MANLNIPIAERNLAPQQVERLDKRRSWGLTMQVMSGQFTIFAVLLTVWAGQDLTYSPHWIRPMAYYDAFTFITAIVLGIYGTALRRGSPEF